MASEGRAFAPGHITAFFEVVEDPDPFKKGSRGAGLCTTLGVRTRVKARLGRKQRIRVYLNREEVEAETTRLTVRRLIGGAAFDVVVQSDVQLPVSQGFGMSAAGALSTGLAVNDALDLGLAQYRVAAVAHAAEVQARTGLGDVVPATQGGMDLRMEPGGPPNAVVRRFPVEAELLLAVLGPPLTTRSVLSDAAKTKAISTVGRRCVEEFSPSPGLESLFSLGKRFAVETGLAQGKVRDALEAAAPYGMAAQAMLGNAVFAAGKLDELDAIFRGLGAQRYRCRVDNKGARLE